jgi:hypothetical protein
MDNLFIVVPEDWQEWRDALVGAGVEVEILSQSHDEVKFTVPKGQVAEAEAILKELRRR